MRQLLREAAALLPHLSSTEVSTLLTAPRLLLMARQDGWSALFATAFKQSRNAMVLLDSRRRVVDANGAYLKLLGYSREALIGRPIYDFIAGQPLPDDAWSAALATGDFTGETELLCADGGAVSVQWGAHVEVVTGHRLVLFVALSTSRWGRRFRRATSPNPENADLSEREREIVRLVAHGSTGPEIADELNISHDTVRTHVRNAMTKVGARSRAHLVAKALGNGHVP
jgi:PAS domain S-box-containing protein